MVISQDLSKPKRQENIEGTEQYNLMKQEMEILYEKAKENYISGSFQDCSALNYTMTPETTQKWV